MISQLLSKAKLPSIFDLGGAAPAEGGEGGKTAGFSSLLNALGEHTAATGKAPTAAPEGEIAADATATAVGKPATEIAATGKTLPPALPVLAAPAIVVDPAALVPVDASVAQAGPDNETPAATTEEAEAGEGENAVAMAVEAVAVAAIIGASQPAPTAADAPASATGTTQAATRAFVASPPLTPGNDHASAPVAAAPTRGEPAPAASVSLQVAPLPANADQQGAPREALAAAKPEISAAEPRPAATGDRSAQRDSSGEQRPAAELAAKPMAKVTAEAAPTQFASTPAAPVVAHASAEPAVDGVRPFAAERPGLETQVARELSRIVDSLSAAREALTAKTATLAFDHADFGELSLRFDQRRDGQLAVQLSAADPDAHRAVAAAVAERPAFAQNDAGANAQQQQAGANGNGSARGAAGERDGNAANNNPARQDRNEQQRGQARADDTNHSGERRSGIFA